MTFQALAPMPASKFIVHTSTAQIGGAEYSLLQVVEESGEKPLFLVPTVDTLTETLFQRGLEFQVLA